MKIFHTEYSVGNLVTLWDAANEMLREKVIIQNMNI